MVEVRVASPVRARRHLCPGIETVPAGHGAFWGRASVLFSVTIVSEEQIKRLNNNPRDKIFIRLFPIPSPPSVKSAKKTYFLEKLSALPKGLSNVIVTQARERTWPILWMYLTSLYREQKSLPNGSFRYMALPAIENSFIFPDKFRTARGRS